MDESQRVEPKQRRTFTDEFKRDKVRLVIDEK